MRTAQAAGADDVTSAKILAIAVPITLSNATTPLIGFVDTAVIGQIGEAHLIGAVAVASNVFSFVFWAFGFLRMGTTGLTAQAVGSANSAEIAANLFRPLLIGIAAGVILIAVQVPLAAGAFALVGASEAVTTAASAYFQIRIWAAPIALMNYALLGWFIGQAKADVAFILQLVLNLINIALSALFVLMFEWGVVGVAAATVIAEGAALVVGLILAARRMAHIAPDWRTAHILDPSRFAEVVSVNADIMIRTLCLLTIFFIMTASAARADDVTLAANALLLAITAITVYFIDGFAYAAETLVGQAIGAHSRKRFVRAAKLSTLWAGAISVVLSLILWVSGPAIIAAMTPDVVTREVAERYLPWAALTPVIGVWCFQLDGIFIGATQTAAMRNMMILSLGVFLALWWVLSGAYGNHGLWAALMASYVVRALSLSACLPALMRRRFASG